MKHDLGTVRILGKRRVVAGEYTTVHYRYLVGHPIDDTGYIKVVFRFAGDFGVPQFNDPRAPNYCRIETTGDCRLDVRWDPKANVRPWDRSIVMKVMSGYLDRGDVVTIVFGDTSGGSPGWRMQTFVEDTFEFRTLVDPVATYQFRLVNPSPTLRIVPGAAVTTRCIAPSRVVAGVPFTYWVKEEDRWGNPVRLPRRLRHRGFAAAGVQRLTVPVTGGGEVQSNPIEVMAAADICEGRFWADLHGQSEETVGSNTARSYFTFARDYGLLDVAAHQGNDFQMSDALWQELNGITREFNQPGRFATLPGYEWSANTSLGGDRNVWFEDEGGPIIRSSLELVEGGKSKWAVAPTAEDLFRRLRRVKSPRPLGVAHVGGRYADLRWHDPKIEFAVEVHSAWGTFEWMLEESFRRGYRVGICANSDGHKGRPGASYPGAGKFGSLGGLTCICADKLDRPAIVAALRARHFYATTGHRPLLNVSLLADGKAIAHMGDICRRGSKDYQLRVEVNGTGPLEYVDVMNGMERIARKRPVGSSARGQRFKIYWSGAECKGRARLVGWDGGMKVEGNTLAAVTPINFLNADSPLHQPNRKQLTWKSNTTGGGSGFIATLRKAGRGSFKISTTQGGGTYPIRADKPKVVTWKCGGLHKQIEICPLPSEPPSSQLTFEISLTDLKAGDNPIYIRVRQEDGHLAWSSPIYLVPKLR